MAGIDLHVHTALSACAENELSPEVIRCEASRRGVRLIAVTDHNAVEHALLMCGRAEEPGPAVIPGVELMSREEVHLLAYFGNPSCLRAFWKEAEKMLPRRENPPRFLGYQVIYDRSGEIRDIDRRMRHQALEIGLEALVELVHDHGGLAVPAHIDKPSFSLLGQLGYVDPGARYDALEISPRAWLKAGHRLGDRRDGFPLLSGSDCHCLEDIGRFSIEDDKGLVRDFLSLRRFLARVRHRA